MVGTKDGLIQNWSANPWVWYGTVITISCVLSIGGFLFGALHDPSSDGGRGGALAVVFAFFGLFVKSDFALRKFQVYATHLPKIHRDIEAALDRLRGKNPPAVNPPSPAEEALHQINGIAASMDEISRTQFKQNLCVALAGSIGTLSWGFGDIAARYIKEHYLPSICDHAGFICRVLR
jgi:hypothetical protein